MLTSVKEKENFNRAQVAEQSVAMTTDCKYHCHVPLENRYGVAINNQFAVLLSDFTLETAVSGIIFKHVGLKKRQMRGTGLGFRFTLSTTMTFCLYKYV